MPTKSVIALDRRCQPTGRSAHAAFPSGERRPDRRLDQSPASEPPRLVRAGRPAHPPNGPPPRKKTFAECRPRRAPVVVKVRRRCLGPKPMETKMILDQPYDPAMLPQVTHAGKQARRAEHVDFARA